MIALLAASALAVDEPVHLDVSAGTYVPLSVGAQVSVEVPYRIRATVGVGTMPGGYLDVINGISTGFGWYDELTADLISAALKNSLLIHPRLGWRPVPKLGFHFGGGVVIASLGGGLSGAETLEALTGEEPPQQGDFELVQVDAAANVTMATVEVGYEVVLVDKLVMDFTLGGAFSVAANSTLTPDTDARTGPGFDRLQDELDSYTSAGEELLNDTLTSYVHTPTLGVMVGYRFF